MPVVCRVDRRVPGRRSGEWGKGARGNPLKVAGGGGRRPWVPFAGAGMGLCGLLAAVLLLPVRLAFRSAGGLMEGQCRFFQGVRSGSDGCPEGGFCRPEGQYRDWAGKAEKGGGQVCGRGEAAGRRVRGWS